MAKVPLQKDRNGPPRQRPSAPPRPTRPNQ